jgi:hypothetical protein
MIKINPAWRFDDFGPFDTCPQCLGELEELAEGDEVDFYCRACQALWHVSMGCLIRRPSLPRRQPAANG